MNAKISLFAICVEAIIYFLSYNMHECNFESLINGKLQFLKHMINTFAYRQD